MPENAVGMAQIVQTCPRRVRMRKAAGHRPRAASHRAQRSIETNPAPFPPSPHTNLGALDQVLTLPARQRIVELFEQGGRRFGGHGVLLGCSVGVRNGRADADENERREASTSLFLYVFFSRSLQKMEPAHPLPFPTVARVDRRDPLRDGSFFDRRPTGDGGGEASGGR